jgi:acid stress-induced BolA-like protein IbaG/YrbA
MLKPDQIQKRIQQALPDADIEVKDLTGTGDHFEALVVSSQFADKGMIERHQLVYGPLQDLLKSGELHALALRTFSPEQWSQLNKPKA